MLRKNEGDLPMLCPFDVKDCLDKACIIPVKCKKHHMTIQKSTRPDLLIMDDMKELVDHPDHYGGKEDTYETIKVMRAKSTEHEFYGWLKLTIFKYIDRLGKKDKALIDIQKAIWYSQYLETWLIQTSYEPEKK